MEQEVYEDRNLLALAFARLAEEKGWPVGWRNDEETPGWPVIYVETPEGQVSWHVPATLIEGLTLPLFPHAWDGHSSKEKRERLRKIIFRLI